MYRPGLAALPFKVSSGLLRAAQAGACLEAAARARARAHVAHPLRSAMDCAVGKILVADGAFLRFGLGQFPGHFDNQIPKGVILRPALQDRIPFWFTFIFPLPHCWHYGRSCVCCRCAFYLPGAIRAYLE